MICLNMISTPTDKVGRGVEDQKYVYSQHILLIPAFVNACCDVPRHVILSKINANNKMLRGHGLSHWNKRLLALIGFSDIIKSIKEHQSKFGGQLTIVSEAYSTIRCSCCGHFSRPGFSRIFQCSWKKCLARMDRDENAARNILIVKNDV